MELDASSFCPQRVATANIIGGIDSNNAMTASYNFGLQITVFAPGVNILSAWSGSPGAIRRASGTFTVRAVSEIHRPTICSVFTPHPLLVRPIRRGDPCRRPRLVWLSYRLSLKSNLRSHALPIVTGRPPGTTQATII